MPRVALGCSLIALAAAGTVASPAMAVTAQEAISALNTQRAAHGIPAGIVEEPAWSQGCANHGSYIAQNGGQLVHDEDPSRPGYTPAGDDAGNRSVLAGTSWSRGNPWEVAPIHLHQLLNPRLSRTGAADNASYSCMVTQGASDGPPPPATAVYTYPGPNTTHRYSETASEAPYTPGERVGIPAGTTTGPYLYVMVDAPQRASSARLDSASVTGPDGPVEIRGVDNQTSGLQGYLPAGVEVIPVRPLRPSSMYTTTVRMTVTLGDGSVIPVEHTWSFTTSAAPPPPTPDRDPVSDPVGDPGGEIGSTSDGTLVLTRFRYTRRQALLSVRCAGGPCSGRVVMRWRGRRRSFGIVDMDGGDRRRLRASISRRQYRSLRLAPISVYLDGEYLGRFTY